MKLLVKASQDEGITVEFKGKIYTDGKRDQFGNIRFGGNEFEYKPVTTFNRIPYVIIHGFKQTSNGYTHTSTKSSAKCIIHENGGGTE